MKMTVIDVMDDMLNVFNPFLKIKNCNKLQTAMSVIFELKNDRHGRQERLIPKSLYDRHHRQKSCVS